MPTLSPPCSACPHLPPPTSKSSKPRPSPPAAVPTLKSTSTSSGPTPSLPAPTSTSSCRPRLASRTSMKASSMPSTTTSATTFPVAMARTNTLLPPPNWTPRKDVAEVVVDGIELAFIDVLEASRGRHDEVDVGAGSDGVGPLDVDVDFRVGTAAGGDGRGLDDFEVGGGKWGQAEQGGESVGIVHDGGRAAPIEDDDGLAGAVETFLVQAV